jgi:AraC-like DNA-binding protein
MSWSEKLNNPLRFLQDSFILADFVGYFGILMQAVRKKQHVILQLLRMMKLPIGYRKGRSLETLVENKTTYTVNEAEMSVFETHQQAEQVFLKFDQPVIATMLKGKKVMHLKESDPFSFLPGESVVLPADGWMGIDFPEATMDNPTKCLAMTIPEETVEEVILLMNERKPKVDNGSWDLLDVNFHFFDDVAIYQIIHRLLFLIVEDHISKDLFVNMMLRELLVRMLQAESQKKHLLSSSDEQTNNRLSYIVNYIRQNIRKKLSIEELCKRTYMSESTFHRVFRNELGISPVDFINEERLRLAASLLHDPQAKVGRVSLQCGFNSLSYFNRMFKKRYQLSPRAYQKQVIVN